MDDSNEFIREISDSEAYKSLTSLYNQSLNNMESIMNEEQFRLVLEHEKITSDVLLFVKEQTAKKIKEDINKTLKLITAF